MCPTKQHKGDGGGSIIVWWWQVFKGGFQGGSTQKQREEEAQRTYAKFDKERLKRGMDRKEKGFDLKVGI